MDIDCATLSKDAAAEPRRLRCSLHAFEADAVPSHYLVLCQQVLHCAQPSRLLLDVPSVSTLLES